MRARTTLLLAVTLTAASGCAELATYARHRGEDLLDVMDLGVTWSAEPGFALYYDLTPFIPIGVGYTNGWFAGLGFGALRFGDRFYEHSMGFIFWGEEEVGWGEFDPFDRETVNVNQAGILGLFSGEPPGPDYFPSCLHYVHLGYVGFVLNLRYLQAVDFLLGWFTVDVCFDDGVRGPAWWGGKNLFGLSPEQHAEPGPELIPMRPRKEAPAVAVAPKSAWEHGRVGAWENR